MNFRKILMLSLFCLLLMNMQCDEDDVTITPCGLEIVIDNDTYENTESSNYTIANVGIDGDCINFNIAASGCDASTWVMTLVDSESIAESMPPQRYLKLTLYNNEACLAVFNKEESFDLIPLRVEGLNEVILNIEGVEDSLLYSY